MSSPTIIVHPTALLGVVDHYNRVARDSRRRVVGVFTGEATSSAVHCTGVIPVPFDEDRADSSVWFLDMDYLETMHSMVRRVNSRDAVVGWYSTGPTLRANDVLIHDAILRRVVAAAAAASKGGSASSASSAAAAIAGASGAPPTPAAAAAVAAAEAAKGSGPDAVAKAALVAAAQPIPSAAALAMSRFPLVVVQVRSESAELPLKAYIAAQSVADGLAKLTLTHVPAEVGATETEEVGVEHLLRDINDPSVSSLADQLRQKRAALAGLRSRLARAAEYLRAVAEGRMPVNNQIVYNIQSMLNLLPDTAAEPVAKAMLSFTNDMHLTMYMASLTRAIIALHDLVVNKVRFHEEDLAAEAAGAPTTAKDKTSTTTTPASSSAKS